MQYQAGFWIPTEWNLQKEQEWTNLKQQEQQTSLDGSYSTAKTRQPSSINKHQSHKAYPTPYFYI